VTERIRIAFTDFWHSNARDAVRRENPIYRLLSTAFDLELSDKPDFLIYSCFGNTYLKHDCTRIFYTGENLRPDFQECDYAFSFDFPTDERNYRLPLYRFYAYFDRLMQRQVHPEPAQRKFCNFVYSNASAGERLRFLDLLNGYREVDCGGKLRNNIGGRVGDKLEFLGNYKFTIAFENSSFPGYTTEKILDPLVAGSVPIYWGNPEVARDFNPACMINCHDFEDFESVVRHVAELDQDDATYQRLLEAPVFEDDRIPDYLSEESILSRFRTIFEQPHSFRNRRSLDPLKYWLLPGTWSHAGRRWWRNRDKG
jgi:hypothetical protein